MLLFGSKNSKSLDGFNVLKAQCLLLKGQFEAEIVCYIQFVTTDFFAYYVLQHWVFVTFCAHFNAVIFFTPQHHLLEAKS
jgi:hypothetical protein